MPGTLLRARDRAVNHNNNKTTNKTSASCLSHSSGGSQTINSMNKENKYSLLEDNMFLERNKAREGIRRKWCK